MHPEGDALGPNRLQGYSVVGKDAQEIAGIDSACKEVDRSEVRSS